MGPTQGVQKVINHKPKGQTMKILSIDEYSAYYEEELHEALFQMHGFEEWEDLTYDQFLKISYKKYLRLKDAE